MFFRPVVQYLIRMYSYLIDTFSLEPKRLVSHDRSILEEVILPYFAKHESYQKVLFVGCSAYTQWYEELFQQKEYWTIDPQRVKRKYGAQRHIVDSITAIERYITANYFDVIIMNGVIGFGLNHAEDIEQGIRACYEVLAPQGVLVLGWNNTSWRTPLDLRAIRALGRFRQHVFAPLRASQYRTQGGSRHTFSFYHKAQAGQASR